MLKEYRMMAFVERWSIAPRHHHQTLDAHSFFVTLYASEICEMLDIDRYGRGLVMDAALRHDVTEVWESDVPGPAKRSLFDPVRHSAYKTKFALSMNGLYRLAMADLEAGIVATVALAGPKAAYYPIRDIIKVADLIDEIFWLSLEINLGNDMVRGIYQREMNRLEFAAQALAGEEFTGQLLDIIGKEIARIGEEGAIVPANDEDIPSDLQFKGTSDHVSDADSVGLKAETLAADFGPDAVAKIRQRRYDDVQEQEQSLADTFKATQS